MATYQIQPEFNLDGKEVITVFRIYRGKKNRCHLRRVWRNAEILRALYPVIGEVAQT